MLKTDGKRQGISIDGKVLDDRRRFFHLLKANDSTEYNQAVFPTFPKPGDKVTAKSMDVIRQLIKVGDTLKAAVYNRASPEMLELKGIGCRPQTKNHSTHQDMILPQSFPGP